MLKLLKVHIILFLALSSFLFVKAKNPVTSRAELNEAILTSNENDVIYVNDIDFDDNPLLISVVTINISKSLTIKGVNEKSILLNGSFNVSSSERITVNFENIHFKGKNEANLKAVGIKGKVKSTITNCVFENYMNFNGALSIGNSETQTEDISVNIFNSEFKNNNGGNGGALFVSNNSKIVIDKCNLNNNKAQNGSAIYICDDAKLDMIDSTITNNTIVGEDAKCGAITANNAEMKLVSCILKENSAKHGGAIYLQTTKCIIDGCLIDKNSAVYGGAIYAINKEEDPVYIINTTISNNESEYNSPVYYHIVIGTVSGKIYSILCTYLNNSSNVGGFDYLFDDKEKSSFLGCIVIDDTLRSFVDDEEVDYIEQLPSKENGYNYIANVSQATSRNVLIDNNINNIFDCVLNNDLPTIPNTSLSNYVGNICIGKNEKKTSTIVLEDGSTINWEYGRKLVIEKPEKKGYKFVCFETEDGKVLDISKPIYFLNMDSIRLIARYEPKKYQMKVSIDGVEEIYEISYGDEIQIEDPVKKGYKFDGFFTSDDVRLDVGSKYEFDYDLVLEARFIKKFPVALTLSLSFSFVVVLGTLLFIYFRKKKNVVENKIVEVDLSILTEREKEVIDLLLEGKKRSEIGKILCLSENTIKKQISSIYRKLNISTRSELFAKFHK